MKLGELALVAALSLTVVGSASAATASIQIRQEAVAIQGGEAVLVFVEVECSLGPGEVLLEGNLSVSQDGAFGMTGLNPACDGRRRLYPIRVRTFDGTFEAGEAFASAFLLFLNEETQETRSVSQVAIIDLRGRPA